MPMTRHSGRLIMCGVVLMALAGLSLLAFPSAFTLHVALSLSAIGVLLTLSGFLLLDMEKLRRKDDREAE